MAAGKCGQDASGLSLEVSSEPRGASAEHIMCALQKSRHLHPQGPSTGPCGTSFHSSVGAGWAEHMARRAKLPLLTLHFELGELQDS